MMEDPVSPLAVGVHLAVVIRPVLDYFCTVSGGIYYRYLMLWLVQISILPVPVPYHFGMGSDFIRRIFPGVKCNLIRRPKALP